MKVCVYGAGAIGGHLAARLHRGGAQTSIVARGPNLHAIRARGLRVTASDGVIEAPVQASGDPAELGRQDAVIVTVKAPALPAVAAAIGPLLGADTPVVFAMNGIPWFYFHGDGEARIDRLDADGALWRQVGPERAIAGVVYSACTVTAPGEVHVENARSRIVLGEPGGAPTARTEALAAVLLAGGIGAELSPNIREAIWSKLLLNLGSGLLAVLTGGSPSAFFQEPACRDITRALLLEGAAIAASLGVAVTPDAEGQIRNGSASRHKSSILQDLELGRPMEIDALHTVPLELGRAHGVPMPIFEMLAAMVRARARAAGLYP